MATNKIKKIAVGQTTNTYSDDSIPVGGIDFGEVAYSNKLNAYLRQLSTLANAIGDLLAENSAVDIVTEGKNAVNKTIVENSLKAIMSANRELKVSDQANNTTGPFSIWMGKQSHYNSLPNKSNTTIYIITD